VDRLWTGWWWPMSSRGTAYRRWGQKSPMGKYDLATGSSAEQWEIRDSKVYAHVPWAGHCNGLAAAGIMLEEPKHSVTYRQVLFHVRDIKALLVEMWQGSGWIIGDKCGESTLDRHGRIREAECRDLNPGTFHLAITNWLGLFGKSVIVDMDNSEAVWNYAVASYKVLKSRWMTPAEAASTMHADDTPYIYNQNAVDIVFVHTEISTINAGVRRYEYLLELDADGKVLGGEWYGASKKDHPDFIWRPQDSKSYNPHLNPDTIMEIYLKSL